jgi:LPS O-antigen subunit length determinant protein (WzzB/FepE family)
LTVQKKTTYYLLAGILCFLIGVVISLTVSRKRNSRIETAAVVTAAVQSTATNNTRVLTLCELVENTSAYSGKEVLVSSTFISKMSLESFSLLSECKNAESITARVTLKGLRQIPEPQLISLVELMRAHGENTESGVGQVIIYGRVDTDRKLVSGEDFHIEASYVRVEMNQSSAHNKRLQRTRR